MPNNKHGAIVADPRSLIRHRYSLIPRRTFPVRKIQFPVPAPREFPDSTLKVRVFFRFDHRFVRQIQRNSLFFPCKQGNPLGAGFAADWSLRQLPFANSRRRANSGEIPPCFKGVWLDRPNLRDWQGGDFRSLNGFRLFPSKPRGIWFGQRKRNVPSRLPIRVDQTFHRSSAARHSIRDTRSGRGAVRRCARLRMRQPEWPDRKGLQNRLLSIPGENSAATASRIAR